MRILIQEIALSYYNSFPKTTKLSPITP